MVLVLSLVTFLAIVAGESAVREGVVAVKEDDHVVLSSRSNKLRTLNEFDSKEESVLVSKNVLTSRKGSYQQPSLSRRLFI